jgi:esterase/lipase superfamily enzyme
MVDPLFEREFEMLVDNGGLPLILFPTSFGSYYQNKDRTRRFRYGYIDAGKVTIYYPDAIDSKVSTTNRFIPRIGCARTMHTKT